MASPMDQLLSPFELGAMTLRNRVVVPGHTTNFGQANRPTARHTAYHAERAAGGVGLIITEAIRVHPTSAGRHISLGSFDDESIPAYASIADAVHHHGAALFAQIMHAGRQANGDATRTAAWSASPLPWSAGAATPHAMGRHDIAVLIGSFAAAARRMRAAGYDGLEVHAGHGHLLQQFLSPATNLRRDEYGGDPERRLRLTREILAAVSQSAPSFPIGLRVSADEFLEGGLNPAAMIEIVGKLRQEFPLAYVHVSHSAYHGSWSLSTQIADMSFGHAPFRRHASMFRRALAGLPVIAVCRLDSLREAAELIQGDEADLVALARPHIADPHLVRKAIEGREAESRACIACNQACIGRIEVGLPISCVVNPEVGAEAEWNSAWAVTESSRTRRVLVIGGGPAGMQAAISANRAGDTVTLVEKGTRLGGQIRLAAAMPNRSRIGLMIDDLEREISIGQIDVRLSAEMSAAEVLAGGWEHIIVATGSTPRRADFGLGIPVLTSWEAAERIAEGSPWDDAVIVVFDEEGGWPAASLTEGCAALSATVHLVSPTANLASRITTYSRLALLPRLRQAGVRAHLMATMATTGPGELCLTDTLSGEVRVLRGVTAIVDVGRPTAKDDLYRALDKEAAGPRVHVVGDANSPRTALEAIYEGRMGGAFLAEHSTPEVNRVAATY